MRYLQYIGPSDMFDASNITAKPTIFYKPGTPTVPPDQRGNVERVTNEIAEELMTYPGHQFVEVEETEAKVLTTKQDETRKRRQQQEALFAAEPANAGLNLPVPSITSQIQALPSGGVPVAASAPASAAQIRAESRAAATPAATTTPSTPSASVMQPTGNSTDTASTGE